MWAVFLDYLSVSYDYGFNKSKPKMTNKRTQKTGPHENALIHRKEIC